MFNKKNISKVIFIFFFLTGNQLFAQSTTLKFPTNTNTSSFDIKQSNDNNVFRIFGDGGFYVSGTHGVGVIPVEGAGSRLMWFPFRSAFRVGNVTASQWDLANIGSYSVAMGFNTTASSLYSVALGRSTTASGNNSIALGRNSVSSGIVSTSIGEETNASGTYSLALGYFTTATNSWSVSIGRNSISSGQGAVTIGRDLTASGSYSFAMGNNVSTNNMEGAFIIGDFTNTLLNSSAFNQMTMRFSDGYRLFTNAAATIGAHLPSGANSWTTISDSSKKENFIYADGEYFLNSLSKLRLGSWNYKTQDEKTYRHYGPIAQEIFYYFGKDELGIIGNDTTISSADIDGIMMIMLHALEKRTSELNTKQQEIIKAAEKISELEKIISAHQDENNVLTEKISLQEKKLNEFLNEFTEMKKALSFLQIDKTNNNFSSNENELMK